MRRAALVLGVGGAALAGLRHLLRPIDFGPHQVRPHVADHDLITRAEARAMMNGMIERSLAGRYADGLPMTPGAAEAAQRARLATRVSDLPPLRQPILPTEGILDDTANPDPRDPAPQLCGKRALGCGPCQLAAGHARDMGSVILSGCLCIHYAGNGKELSEAELKLRRVGIGAAWTPYHRPPSR